MVFLDLCVCVCVQGVTCLQTAVKSCSVIKQDFNLNKTAFNSSTSQSRACKNHILFSQNKFSANCRPV